MIQFGLFIIYKDFEIDNVIDDYLLEYIYEITLSKYVLLTFILGSLFIKYKVLFTMVRSNL